MTIIFLKLYTFSLFGIITTNNQCSQDSLQNLKYYLIEKCHRSTLSTLVKANFISLSSCQKLGIEKRGLALNFSPPENMSSLRKDEEPPQFTCEILKCAESEKRLSLTNDSRFDYYSLYANPLPHVNATCIPGLGMFLLLKSQNFTLAKDECKNRSGLLTDLMNEKWTDGTALMLSGVGIDVAYVGVKSDNRSQFLGQSGRSLNCETYRAWEPGHPKRKRWKFRCVGITKTRTWRTLECKRRLPALCELKPEGPYNQGSIFVTRNQSDSDTNAIS